MALANRLMLNTIILLLKIKKVYIRNGKSLSLPVPKLCPSFYYAHADTGGKAIALWIFVPAS